MIESSTSSQSYLIMDEPSLFDAGNLLYDTTQFDFPAVVNETLLARYLFLNDTQARNCNFVDTVSTQHITTQTDMSDYLYYTRFGLHSISSDTENPGLIYDSGAFGVEPDPQQMYTNVSNLSITRVHFQEWAPFIGVNPMEPQGSSSDETTQFILYSSSSNSGRILSFNGNEAYLSLFVKDGDGNYTGVEDTDISHFPDLESKRLSIDRFHSGYTWDMSKTLDSTISFKTVYDYETIGSEVVEIPFGYEEGTDSILTEEQTMVFYGNFIPMKATYIDASAATPVENGGDASDEPVGTLGGGGADV